MTRVGPVAEVVEAYAAQILGEDNGAAGGNAGLRATKRYVSRPSTARENFETLISKR
jgi:hypothetical protein